MRVLPSFDPRNKSRNKSEGRQAQDDGGGRGEVRRSGYPMPSITPMMIADMAAAAKNSRMRASHPVRRASLERARRFVRAGATRFFDKERLAGLIQVKSAGLFFYFVRARLAGANES
jgi:hypothetical protein